jgi:hypothetical protein
MRLIATIFGRRRLRVGVLVVAGLALASWSEAASITWSAAQNILGDTDVSTTGTLVAAFNLGPTGVAATTVNGVLFNPFVVTGPATTATSGNFTFTTANSLTSNANTGSTQPPFSTLSASYRALLGTASGSQGGAPLTLTMSGLDPWTRLRI